MRLTWISIVVAAAATICGCDEGPKRPQPRAPQPAAAPADARPTTQAMARMPRKKLQLDYYPLTLRVPEPWKMERLGTVTFIQGPTPNSPESDGLTRFIISRLPDMPRDMLERLRSATAPATAPATMPVDPAHREELRPLGAAMRYERRQMRTIAGEPPVISWGVTVYVNNASGRLTSYQLTAFDISLDQFLKDRQLLEEIVGSIEYDQALDKPPQ